MILVRHRSTILGFPLCLGVGLVLLLLGGPTDIHCHRISANQVNCDLTRKSAFGLLEQETVKLSPLRAARLDTTIKRALEEDAIYETKKTAYSAVLVADRPVLWNPGYDDNIRQHSNIVSQINTFLSDPNQTELYLSDRKYNANFLSLVPLSGAVAILGMFCKDLSQKVRGQD